MVFLDVKDEESNYKFGIVTRTYADKSRVKIFTSIDGKEGKDTVFTSEEEIDLKVDQKLVGSAVKFRLNSDGEIADGKLILMPYGSALKMAKGEDFGKDFIKANNARSYAIVGDKITVINAPKVQDKAPVDIRMDYGDLQGETYGGDRKIDIGKFELTSWEDMKEAEYDRNLEFYLFTKDNTSREVEGLIFIGEGSSDEVAVYVVDQWRKGSDTVVEYVSYPDNKKQTRVLAGVYGGKDDVKEKAYIGEERSTGELMLYQAIPSADKEYFDFTMIRNAKISKIDGDFIEVSEEGKAGIQRIYIEGALIYSKDSSKSSSSLKEGHVVDIIKEGNRARMIGVIGS